MSAVENFAGASRQLDALTGCPVEDSPVLAPAAVKPLLLLLLLRLLVLLTIEPVCGGGRGSSVTGKNEMIEDVVVGAGFGNVT